MTQSSPDAPVVKAYWQPGCTSCLRMKEFLTKHGVPFVSVNVLEDKDAFEELAALGVRSVPIIRRGEDWANGQVLARRGARRRHPMGRHASIACVRAGRTTGDHPDGGTAPFRADSRRQDSAACCRIAPAATPSSPTTSSTSPTRSWSTRCRACRSRRACTAAYRRRRWIPRPRSWPTARMCVSGFETWWDGPGQTADFSRKANVYYGDVTVHEFLERTTWHSGPARAPARHGARHARHRARRSHRPGDVCWTADARKGLGRRTAHGVTNQTCPAGQHLT